MLSVVFRKRVELAGYISRICCFECGAVKQIALPFADPKKHYTRALERCVNHMSIIPTNCTPVN